MLSSRLTSLLSFVNLLSCRPISPWHALSRPSPFFSLSPRYATESLHLRKEHNPAWISLTIDQLYLSLFLGLVPLNETVQTEVIPVVRYPPRQSSAPRTSSVSNEIKANLQSPSSHSTRLLSLLATSSPAWVWRSSPSTTSPRHTLSYKRRSSLPRWSCARARLRLIDWEMAVRIG